MRQIDHDCFALPKSCLQLNPLGKVTMNQGWKGLSKEDACNFDNWQHVRECENKEMKDQMARGESVYNHDFLDRVSADMPKQCWSIRMDTTG